VHDEDEAREVAPEHVIHDLRLGASEPTVVDDHGDAQRRTPP
jgi:hypothetical protein